MKNILLAGLIALSLGLPVSGALAAPAAAAQSAVVDTAFVKDAVKRGAVVWDVRAAADYAKGHLPGAVNIGDAGKVLRNDHDEDYVPLAQLEKLLGAGGIDPAREVIVYGDKGNPYVYFGLLTLQYLGAQNARIYHGGVDDWKAAGETVSTEPVQPKAVALKLQPRADLTVATQDVLKSLQRKDVQIVDVRTPKEYSGEDIRAIRGGHIPGAVNIPYEQNWVDPATPAKLAKKEVASKDGMALKPREQLKALYAGLDPNKETVVYCQSGVRAAETATVLKDLGFKSVKVYDSSWLGYGNTLAAPAESVSFLNVGALAGKIDGLLKRIDALEKQVVEAKRATM